MTFLCEHDNKGSRCYLCKDNEITKLENRIKIGIAQRIRFGHKISKLTEECKRLKEKWVDKSYECGFLKKDIIQWKRYAHHKKDCSLHDPSKGVHSLNCDCGLDNLLKE